MSKKELIAKAKAGKVEFLGNVEVSQIWIGWDHLHYYAQYADKNGIHACPNGEEHFIDDYEPLGFDELPDKVYEELISDML